MNPSYLGVSGKVFPFQAIAITVEDLVVDVGKKVSIRDGPLVKLVGYIWTSCWLLLTSLYLMREVLECGGGHYRMFHQSVIHVSLAHFSSLFKVDISGWVSEKFSVA